MKKLLARTAIGLTAASMFAATLAPAAALAATNRCVIRDNGAHSTNSCRIRITKTQTIRQNNWAAILNVVIVVASTGDNKANNNTGGDVTVTSGEATASATIVNEINQTNTAN